jgi:hypothetical protein
MSAAYDALSGNFYGAQMGQSNTRYAANHGLATGRPIAKSQTVQVKKLGASGRAGGQAQSGGGGGGFGAALGGAANLITGIGGLILQYLSYQETVKNNTFQRNLARDQLAMNATQFNNNTESAKNEYDRRYRIALAYTGKYDQLDEKHGYRLKEDAEPAPESKHLERYEPKYTKGEG